MRKLLTLALMALMTMACKPSAQNYLDFLYESMPLPDSVMHSQQWWMANVQKTLEVREKMKWDIPEQEFRHFVLPLRVNNENLDDFRLVYADSLCERVKGLSIADAALEINHWCFERATYTPSDGRTISPLGIIRSGLGRCGEESTFTVSALRAAGIPARQVYTPRWAHTDDNHAWVEVFVDGKWHFMGACEPEAVLDLGWFNAGVSRAMLLHTKAFGDYRGPEDVISKTPCYTEINVIDGYIPSRRTSVTVVDTEGMPVEGAAVTYGIYNYAELYPVAHYTTDASGKVSLMTGLGDITVWASKGDAFGVAVAHSEENTMVLDHKIGEACTIDLDIVPPVENPLPDNSTEEQKAANAKRMEAETAMRQARPHPRTEAPDLFLSRKDAIDVTEDVLEDARLLQVPEDMPKRLVRNLISPRVELEPLYPFRAEAKETLKDEQFANPNDIVAWIKSHIKIDESRNPQGLRIPPVGVLRARTSDAFSRDIFFVALCRTWGFPARLDRVTSTPQYWNGEAWVTVDFDGGKSEVIPTGVVCTSYTPTPDNPVTEAQYYRHYSIAKVLPESRTRQCEFYEFGPVSPEKELEEGYYVMTSGTRLSDGSVLARLRFFNLPAGEKVDVPITLRSASDELSVIGNMAISDELLSMTGRGYFLLCITGIHDEPTSHAMSELGNLAGELNAWGRPVVVLDGRKPEGLQNMIPAEDKDGAIRKALEEGVKAESPLRLPIIAVADSFGNVVYLSQGYNTSLASQLQSVLKKL